MNLGSKFLHLLVPARSKISFFKNSQVELELCRAPWISPNKDWYEGGGPTKIERNKNLWQTLVNSMCKNYNNAYLLIFKVESPYQLAKNYNARCKYMYLWVEKSTARKICLPTKHSTLKMVQSLTWTDPGLEQNTCMYCLVIWDK